MEKRKQKILWNHALELGLAQIGDGIVTIFTLGKWSGGLELKAALKIGKWRQKYKDKFRRN